jgi:hypothetical protein
VTKQKMLITDINIQAFVMQVQCFYMQVILLKARASKIQYTLKQHKSRGVGKLLTQPSKMILILGWTEVVNKLIGYPVQKVACLHNDK